MKKVIKSNIKFIIGVITGAILFGGIGIYAATLTFASGDVAHTNSDGTTTTVQAAINDLYEKAENVGTSTPTILTATLSSTSASVSTTFDLSSYNIKSDASNVLVYISSYSGSLSGTGGSITGSLTKSYNSETKILTVTRSSSDYVVRSNSCNIVVIIL